MKPIMMDVAGFAAGWNNVIALIPPKLLWTFTIVGTVIAVFGGFVWAWGRRKGNKGHTAAIFTIIVGASLAAPKAIIPVFLMLADFLIGIVIFIIKGFAS